MRFDSIRGKLFAELKSQIEDYLHNLNEEALPEVFQSLLKRKLSGKHEETDDELFDELLDDSKDEPIKNVTNEEFEEDFDDSHTTDDEIEDLYNARNIVIRRKASDPYFNMTDTKWDEMIKEATDHGYLQDMRECEDILEDMLNWDKLLPGTITMV